MIKYFQKYQNYYLLKNNMNLEIYNFTDNTYKYDGNSRPNKKINKNTIFECASLSKQVFAYICAMCDDWKCVK